MPRTYITVEYFQYIEKKGSVSVDEFAQKFGLARSSAAVWLSNWTQRGYLAHVPYDNSSGRPAVTADTKGRPKGTSGRYKIGHNWWGDIHRGKDV